MLAAATVKFAHAAQPVLEKHWAFQPITSQQGRSIDEFISAKLREQGLSPSLRADRRTLIRRATFDLTGLPPSSAEVEAFVKDQSPDAYARMIERLLASPHYGEQWARHWLDVARYSDTKGYVYAREEKRWVHAWVYRDWVVRALNEDMPYDRFVRLQIAADQMVPAGSPDLAAMGYLTIGRRFLGVMHDIIDDRIDVVTRGMLGLTVACARCHDHKYDPIPTKDYYSLYGVFRSSAEALVPCSRVTADSELEKRQKALRDGMQKRREEQMARNRARVREHLEAQLELEKYPREGFDQIIEEKDINPFTVHRWEAWLEKDRQSTAPVLAEWHRLAAKNDKPALRALAARCGEQLHDINELWQAYRKVHSDAKALPDAKDEALRRVLYAEDSPCFVPDEHIANNELFFPTNIITELWKLQGEVDRWLVQNAATPAFATVLVDRPQPVNSRVFLRGNPQTRGDEVPRQFLGLFGRQSAFTKGSGRLELANAIATPRNPLTARVLVNRVWMHHFGRGLVSTTGDFGTRAEAPSHPELLDWLAQRFMDSGWSMKSLHRLIMLSETYQQDATGPRDPTMLAKARQLDPANRLLWHMSAHRLSFEEARDSWLSVSGEINLRAGGKPEALFGKQNARRTLYAQVDRENVAPVLRCFDFANPDLSIPQRTETTVPQQALFVMNHPFVVERVSAVVRSLPQGDATARVRELYAKLFQRAPSDEELKLALSFTQTADVGTSILDPWKQFAQVLMLSNEFMFVD